MSQNPFKYSFRVDLFACFDRQNEDIINNLQLMQVVLSFAFELIVNVATEKQITHVNYTRNTNVKFEFLPLIESLFSN